MIAFMMAATTILLLPFAVATAVRIVRRGTPPTLAPESSQSAERIDRLERAVDSIAAEMERMSEGQRFLTKLLAERSRT